MSSEAVVSAQELDYSTLVSSHGSYRISRVRPLDQDLQELNDSSAIESQFELPTGSKVVNLSKSALTFTLTKSAESDFACLHSLGMVAINRIVAYDKGGQYLCEVNDFGDMHRALSPYLTSQQEFLSNPSARGGLDQQEKGFNVFPSQAALSGVATTTLGAREGVRLTHGVTGAEAADVPYLEPQYITHSASAGAISIQYQLPFKQIYHTLLATNRDIYFGSNIMISVFWSPYRQLGFRSSAPGSANLGTRAELGTGATISNIQLKLAIETNPEIVSFLVNSVRSSGVVTKVPYVRRYQFVNNTGTNISNQIRLNRRNGMRLLNIYSCLFDQDTTGVNAHSLCNFEGATNVKEASFQSALNNNNLQEYRPACTAGEDYEILQCRGLLDGCVVSTNNMYQHNRVWVDSWRAGPMCTWKDRDSDVDGVDLSEEIVWNMDKTVISDVYRHLCFVVTLRELSISPTGQITLA